MAEKNRLLSTHSSVWSHQTICLITGASRGFGQRMAVRFAYRLPAGSALVLTARDAAGLAATKAAIYRICSAKEITVETWSIDLAVVDCARVEEYMQALMEKVGNDDRFKQAILVHNAASMGDITRLAAEQNDARSLNEYWQVNLTSMIILNSVFWKYFDERRVHNRLVIHVTSICAKQPFKSFSLYCAGT